MVIEHMTAKCTLVALHPEGVDRNLACRLLFWVSEVALHPEGVDRNWSAGISIMIAPMSPSTRRAWIEISSSGLYS